MPRYDESLSVLTIVRAVPSESKAPLTVRLIVVPSPNLSALALSLNPRDSALPINPDEAAAPATAEDTPDDVDPVPVEAVTLGTEIVGMLGADVVVFGIVTLGTLIDGAEICDTLGKNGIEL